MHNTKIISAFPGVGKSWLFENDKSLKILDSDSSNFSWIEKGVRHPEFPGNYIQHIKDNIGKVDIILVSSHQEVREALVEAGLDIILVSPNKNAKDEYRQRYFKRGSNLKFIELVMENWEAWIEDIEQMKNCTHISLKAGHYLNDIII